MLTYSCRSAGKSGARSYANFPTSTVMFCRAVSETFSTLTVRLCQPSPALMWGVSPDTVVGMNLSSNSWEHVGSSVGDGDAEAEGDADDVSESVADAVAPVSIAAGISAAAIARTGRNLIE